MRNAAFESLPLQPLLRLDVGAGFCKPLAVHELHLRSSSDMRCSRDDSLDL